MDDKQLFECESVLADIKNIIKQEKEDLRIIVVKNFNCPTWSILLVDDRDNIYYSYIFDIQYACVLYTLLDFCTSTQMPVKIYLTHTKYN